MFIFTKNLVLLFENNQIITASRIMILMYEMTMNKRFNMIGLDILLIYKMIFQLKLIFCGLSCHNFNRFLLVLIFADVHCNCDILINYKFKLNRFRASRICKPLILDKKIIWIITNDHRSWN